MTGSPASYYAPLFRQPLKFNNIAGVPITLLAKEYVNLLLLRYRTSSYRDETDYERVTNDITSVSYVVPTWKIESE
jgi:hypothetical protein